MTGEIQAEHWNHEPQRRILSLIAPPAGKIQNPRSGKGDILIVDDDLPDLQMLSVSLSENGYKTRRASNGKVPLFHKLLNTKH